MDALNDIWNGGSFLGFRLLCLGPSEEPLSTAYVLTEDIL